MKFFLATNKLHDIESIVAAKEQQRLQDLLIFVEEYVNSESSIKTALKLLSSLPSEWFLKLTPQMQPYVQFQIYLIENILAKSIDDKFEKPIFNSVIIGELIEMLISLYNLATGIAEKKELILKWQDEEEDNNSVFLDCTSTMAKQLVLDNFSKNELLSQMDIDEKAWKQSFKSSERILLKFMPEVISHLHKHLRIIIPIKAQDSRISLSSTPMNVNGVFLASWIRSKFFAETLVHEVSHDCLNKLCLIEPLVEDSQRGFYSPFRNDTRPASGLLHAAYSFLNVCQYLFRVSNRDERLSRWAEDRLSGFLYNTLVCCQTLNVSDELTKSGKELVLSMISELSELKNKCEFILDEEMYRSKQEHFELWAASADKESEEFSREIFEEVLFETPVWKNVVKMERKCIQPIVQSLKWFRENYHLTNVPVIILGDSLVEDIKLKAELDVFRKTKIKVLDASKHKGFADTPGRYVTMDQHISSFRKGETKNSNFSVVKSFQNHLSTMIWKNDKFFDDFWFDGEHSWLFWNPGGLVVPLHNDSVNNLHCVIEGEKLFYLSQPEENFHIAGPENDFNDGFSSFKPFNNKHLSKKFGTFVKISAGDMIYIPSGWWHCVKYVTDCIAVSTFDEHTS